VQSLPQFRQTIDRRLILFPARWFSLFQFRHKRHPLIRQSFAPDVLRSPQITERI
jgi:hypothetical protein